MSLTKSTSWQLADSFAGIAYAFSLTLIILYLMKTVVFLSRMCFGTRISWHEAADFDEESPLHDHRFEATEQQRLHGFELHNIQVN